MSKRITLISFMDKNEVSKVEQLMSKITESTCKVPYGIIEFNTLALFDYPGEMITKIIFNKE